MVGGQVLDLEAERGMFVKLENAAAKVENPVKLRCDRPSFSGCQ